MALPYKKVLRAHTRPGTRSTTFHIAATIHRPYVNALVTSKEPVPPNNTVKLEGNVLVQNTYKGQKPPPVTGDFEWVGTRKWIYEKLHPGLVQQSKYAVTTISDELLHVELARTLIEIYLYTFQNRPLEDLHKTPIPTRWPDNIELNILEGNSQPLIIFRSKDDAEQLLEDLLLDKNTSQLMVTESQGYSYSNEKEALLPSWERICLKDDTMRFHVLKRLMRRTGRRLSDSDLIHCKDAGSLYSLLIKKKELKEKLFDKIVRDGWLGLPNVKVSKARVRTRARDVEEGRSKIIREELKKRGLPHWR